MKYYFIKDIRILLFLLFFPGVLFAQGIPHDESEENYRLQPGDVLNISILDEVDLSREVKVLSNGKIIYPLLGEVAVQGKDLIEVTNTLKTLLSEYLIEPHVSVYIKEYAKVYVYGEIVRPGAYELSENLTLLQTIAIAGGLKEKANSKKIKIKRKRNGYFISIPIDLSFITQKEHSDADIALCPNDVIIIPESFL
ncbi:MAG: polysaccharide export protein [Candidatus Aureabacteria bacterium]|nr:polysaccharide export protein [Candidatus Auribacterota bacterium]